jgi:hypothetical protein
MFSLIQFYIDINIKLEKKTIIWVGYDFKSYPLQSFEWLKPTHLQKRKVLENRIYTHYFQSFLVSGCVWGHD